MSTSARNRHALGMPSGSVRAILSLCVLLYLWVMALGSSSQDKGLLTQPGASTAFIYMLLMQVLALAQYIVAHGRTIRENRAERPPLWLPGGLMRLAFVAGFFGLVYYTWVRWSGNPKVFETANAETIMIVSAIIMASFLLGHLSTLVFRWMGGGQMPFWAMDVQAWVSLVSVILLGWVLLARLVINPTVSAQTQLTLYYTEPMMAAFVAFYYGARS